MPASDPRLSESLRLGTLLYAYDQAAWHGTDDFRERAPDLLSKTCGWVVTGPANASDLAFVDCAYKNAVYRARFDMGKMVFGAVVQGTDKAPLSELEQRTLAARNIGMEALGRAKVAACANARPNLAIIPSSAPGKPTYVYLLTPQIDLNIVPFGGHYRVEVDSDGKAGKVRAFTKACLNLSKPPEDVEGIVVTHLLDPVPTEIHVFNSLVIKKPVYVGTSDKKTWRVDGSEIAVVDLKRN